jgi:hypothetical protein
MSVSNFLIPLANTPQSFQITLAGVTYTMTVKWNAQPDAGWVMDLADSNNNSLAAGIPLITGLDCLSGLEYLGIEGSLFVMTNGDPFAVPTLDNLGTDSNLYFQTSVASG